MDQIGCYTVKEIAAIFKVSRSTVYKWAESNPPEIPCLRLAGKNSLRFPKDAVHKYIEKITVHPTTNGRKKDETDA